MTDITVFCAVCIICAVISLMIKKYNPEISLLISLTAGIITAAVLLSKVIPAVNDIKSIINRSGISNEYTVTLIKALGICFICEFACDTCEDAGEKALSAKIQLAGKIAIVILTLPMIKEVADTAIKLING